MPPEMVVQAETRFSESPFVQECLEWHNNYRRKHSAPDLTLDPPVSTFILVPCKFLQLYQVVFSLG